MATVLVVDDRAVNRDLVRTILGYAGHHVIEADNGAQALRLVKSERPDLMISDVLMPGMDGYELAREVRALPVDGQLPIVFYTANYLEREARPIAAACGVEHIVAKDGDPRALIAAVDSALGSVPAPAQAVREEDFSREHLRVLNSKLLDKVRELEEKERLNQLVEAAVQVGRDLGVHNTLSRIVSTARSLVAGRYATLRMQDADGYDLGAAEDGVRSEPGSGASTIEVDIVAPDGHRGTLSVIGKHAEGGFTEGDEHLVRGLASAAGTAVNNAFRFDDARRRQAWLRASAESTAKLLGAPPEESLATVVRSARLVANADFAWIEVVDDDAVTVPAQENQPEDHDERAMLGAGLLRKVGASGAALVLHDATASDVEVIAHPAANLDIGPVMAVPLQAGPTLLGVLIMANRTNRTRFSRLDVEMATLFAGQAAVGLEFARAQADRERLHLVEERARIARDLHDVVIQRLFAVGLRLESMAPRLGEKDGEQILDATEELNHTIYDIRSAIFSLRRTGREGMTLAHRLESLLDRSEQTLGFSPRLTVVGDLNEIREPLHLHLLATVNEALSNIARHAGASSADVALTVADGYLTIEIVDNGRGLPENRQESGLDNLRRRAELVGGAMTTGSPAHGTGLAITWQVPLDA